MKKISLLVLISALNLIGAESSKELVSANKQPKRQATDKEFGKFNEAIKLNDVATVKALLDLGVSPRSRSKVLPLTTFMGEAIDYQRLKIIDCLVKAGENVNGDISGVKWIEMAVRQNKLHSFKYLISLGADISNIETGNSLVAFALLFPQPERKEMAKIALDLNPAIKGEEDTLFRNFNILNAFKQVLMSASNALKQELKQEKNEMKTILMLHNKNGDNQLKRLPWLVTEELLRFIKGRHDYTGTSRIDLD